MTFCTTVNGVTDLDGHCFPGKRALGNHSTKIVDSTQIRVVGSINLDDALRQQLQNAPRWDYGVGVKRGDSIEAHWVEVHPNHVNDIVRKKEWLVGWLQREAPALLTMTRKYVWITTQGAPRVGSPDSRRANAAGLTVCSQSYRLN